MNDLTIIPPEIWDIIFTLACTDGGRTGLGLALSCRFFYTQSSSARFHTVALLSVASVEGFLAYMNTRPDGRKPAIHHLFLTLLPSKPRTLFVQLSKRRDDPQDTAAIDQHKAGMRENAVRTRYINAAHELFVVVAPILRTLCLTTGYSHSLDPFPCDLPRLKELTIMGSISTITGPNPPRLPALKRVHLIPRSEDSDESMEELANALTASALCGSPLAHLRLSEVHDHERPELLPVLSRTLGVQELPGSPPDDQDDHALALRDITHAALPHIREVIIQIVDPLPALFGQAFLEYKGRIGAFNNFVQGCNEVKDLRVLAVARRQRNFRWMERLYNDWVSRIEGGAGCWVRDAEKEIALETRVERQGDSSRSFQDIMHIWGKDDFNGQWSGDDEIEEAHA